MKVIKKTLKRFGSSDITKHINFCKGEQQGPLGLLQGPLQNLSIIRLYSSGHSCHLTMRLMRSNSCAERRRFGRLGADEML